MQLTALSRRVSTAITSLMRGNQSLEIHRLWHGAGRGYLLSMVCPSAAQHKALRPAGQLGVRWA